MMNEASTQRRDMLYANLHRLVPTYLHAASGKVLYSGRSAFASPSVFYLLGFNPGGDPDKQRDDTIGKNIWIALHTLEDDWSAYVDEKWTSAQPGRSPMQISVQHLCRKLNLDPRKVPASNLIFGRSRRESSLLGKRDQLIEDCWPVHQAVIDALGIRIIICFGQSAGQYVRKVIGADQPVDSFVEKNNRRWTSTIHGGRDQRFVVTLTHPGVASWRAAASDPTDMIERLAVQVNQTALAIKQ
jgi:hypothetical protein